jgi:glycine cleavage system transcriptional repressor
VRHFALAAIGEDKPGIVASLTGVLVDHDVNIEDSQATILRGHFTIMLIVAAPEGIDRDRLASDLDAVAGRLGLEALSLRDVGELEGQGPEPSHMVTIYGVDHPGIVHAATSVLSERGVDITDLNTRLVTGEEGGEALYALLMEVAVPADEPVGELGTALREVADREGVELTLRELEQDSL